MENSFGPFEELTSQDVIVAYETKDSSFYNLLQHVPGEYVEIDLGESTKLKTAFMKYFKIQRLPVVIIKGSPAIDDLEEKVTEYLQHKEKEALERIKNIVDPNLVTVFIKGSPTMPRCGFTKTLIEILRSMDLDESKIKHFDILSDGYIRKKLKEINGWPTFPQIYIKGEFIGGLDVVKKMKEKGKLKEKLSGIV